MPNVYKAGKLYTSGTNVVLNQNNKGILVVPDTATTSNDVQVKFMGDDGMTSPGSPAGVLVDGSGATVPYLVPITVHTIVAFPSGGNTKVVELLSTPTSYPVFNTGIVHTPENVKTGVTDNWVPLIGKPNKGVLISNRNAGNTRTRTFVLASTPTGNMPGDSIQISIPPKTVVIFPIQIYSLDTSDLAGSGSTAMVLLH